MAIAGTARNDLLIGTEGSEQILGLAGDDQIRGLGGNDFIIGGTGDNTISGGWGDDIIFSGTQGILQLNKPQTDFAPEYQSGSTANGDEGNDIVVGYGTLNGGSGNDVLFSMGHYGSELNGGDGNDVLWIGNGRNQYDGGTGGSGGNGNDIIIITGRGNANVNADSYPINPDIDRVVINGRPTGDITLSGLTEEDVIEFRNVSGISSASDLAGRVTWSDYELKIAISADVSITVSNTTARSVVFRFNETDVDGMFAQLKAAVPEAVDKNEAIDIARLYEAGLGRAFDKSGLNYQIDRIESGVAKVDVAAGFLDSPEFTNKYGDDDAMSNLSFIQVMYRNVLDREGEAGGVQYWLNFMAKGYTREDVLVSFAASPENVAGSQYLNGLTETAGGEWGLA